MKNNNNGLPYQPKATNNKIPKPPISGSNAIKVNKVKISPQQDIEYKRRNSMNNNLTELEKKYKELGEEIERLKNNRIGYRDDPIFLLSKEEVEQFKNKIIPEDTSYYFWTRSAYAGYSSSAWGVNGYSGLVFNCRVHYSNAARPALNIGLIGLSVNENADKIVYCGVSWCRLDENTFIAELPIGWHRFDGNSNDYETSEIRKYLLNWYEERKDLK